MLLFQLPRGLRKKGEWNTLNLILLGSFSSSLFCKNQSRLKDIHLSRLSVPSLAFSVVEPMQSYWVWMWLGGSWVRGMGPWLEDSEQPLRVSNMSTTSWSQPSLEVQWKLQWNFLHWKALQQNSAVELKRLSFWTMGNWWMHVCVFVCVCPRARAHQRGKVKLEKKREVGLRSCRNWEG